MQAVHNYNISHRWLSSLCLNAFSSEQTTSFHCQTDYTVKKLFLTFNQNLPHCNLNPFVLVPPGQPKRNLPHMTATQIFTDGYVLTKYQWYIDVPIVG